ncbi:MAG: UDP-N-acetylglucosamine 2-epimerase (non-hydrolyzing) [Bacillota bacterium]|nr:UDP-N-acetylglucosamine 2-epimerase (non-hydrolyzing) [Bacillota bacterium]
MNKIKIISIFGTRPEAIKMCPLVLELSKHTEFESKVCVTAQHRSMLDQVLGIFRINPDYDLDIMEERQTLSGILTKSVLGLDDVFEKEKPDLVLVHGDTSTTFAGALSAFYHKIPVGHVEAGLRTYNMYSPYPEEINRKLTGAIATLHFAPTALNKENLKRENITKNVYVTGNTVIDAIKETVKDGYVFADPALRKISYDKERVILVTAHRRENYGEPLREIMESLKEIAETYKDVRIVYPVHLSPVVRETAYSILGGVSRVELIDPISVDEMHNLIARAYMVMTDSGGLQEEAPGLAKPVLVLRRETERPEAVNAGTVKLAGVTKQSILALAKTLLNSPEEYEKMAHAVNPYGDGHASARIAQAILYYYNFTKTMPEEFNGGC